jgi:hypothetical protein
VAQRLAARFEETNELPEFAEGLNIVKIVKVSVADVRVEHEVTLMDFTN